MYIQYCLIAIVTILVICLLVYYYMKKNNQANKKNTVNLVLCTVVTVLTAVLTPPLAKVFVRELSFPMLGAIITTVILFICLICALFYLLEPKLYKLYGDESTDTPDETGKDDTAAIESSSQQENLTIVAQQEEEETPQIEYQDDDSELQLESQENEDALQIEYQENDSELQLESQEDEEAIDHIVSLQDLPTIPYTSEKTESLEETEEAIEASDESSTQPIETSKEYSIDNREDILEILERAMDDKDSNDYQSAIKAYEAALVLKPEKEVCFLIILDLCSLYKMTNQKELVYNLLASNPCELLDSDKKADIIRNINI